MTHPASPGARAFSFGPFLLFPARQLLMEGEAPVRIGSRAFDILVALVEASGAVVSKQDLLARAWPDVHVEESNLKVNVASLRRALGEAAGGARYVANVSGRGYRFVAPVTVLRDGEAAPGRPSAARRSHNLPAATTRVIGREDAIAAVLQALGESRLVTLVGAGGIGKTTVALATAARALDTVEDGVWFVDLSPLKDPALLPGAIASALGLAPHSADTRAALGTFLRERDPIIVLDNCEHLIDAAAACAEWMLAASAGLRVLATSREPLRARGEQVHRLAPLGTPPESPGLQAAEAVAFPAVELFVERAATSRQGFRLEDEDAPVAAEICRKLDGMALAIELAAARIDAFGMREILGLLDNRLRLLRGSRTAPERHQTLMATLDWSFNLLSEAERHVLPRLAVFAGTFGLESAVAVATDETISAEIVVDALAGLVAKSLLSAEAGSNATRYRLLETTRSYALRKLAANEGETRRRHAAHLRDLAARAAAEWETRPTAEWLSLYGAQVDDIRSALAWAFGESRDIAIGTALTVAAIPFWEHLSLVEECRAAVERALACGGALDAGDEMKLQMALGTALLHTHGPCPAAKQAWTRTLALAEQLGDTDYRLRCLWGLCDTHTWSGAHPAALEIARQIQAIAQEQGDSAAAVNVERQIGTALRYLGDLHAARRHLERMIARYRPPVARADTARFQLDPRVAARGTLANLLWLQGRPDRAVEAARQQLADARAAQHALALSSALVHTACPIALYVGDLAAAEGLLAEIEAHVAKHGMTVWRAMGQCLRGEWLLKSGDATGLAVLREALAALSGAGVRLRCAAHYGALAEGLAAQGERDAARDAIEAALALAAESGEAWCLPDLLRIKGDAIGGVGAEGLYLQALDLARKQGALSFELRAAVGLAELGKGTDALRAVYGRFEEGFETRDLIRARGLLAGTRGRAVKRRPAPQRSGAIDANPG